MLCYSDLVNAPRKHRREEMINHGKAFRRRWAAWQIKRITELNAYDSWAKI